MMSHLLTALAVSLGINLVMFMLAFRYKSDRLASVSYPLSFIVLAIYGLTTGQMTTSNLIIFAMVIVWAGRLGSFLLMRSMKKGAEKHFTDMQSNFTRSAGFWLGQTVTAWVVSLPVLLVFTYASREVSIVLILGVLVWLKGLMFETIADLQKFEFSNKAGNKGKWIESGLWRYSRHPNYFGEILVWLGVYVATVPVLDGSVALLAGIGPLYITMRLLLTSGIPSHEKLADKRWGKDKNYQAYKKRTSLLVPMPPKK